MPKHLALYDVFIGSPGGLVAERQAFRDAIQRFNELHGVPNGAFFRAVGWEDTLGGVGRPQTLINAELRSCDYAFFVLHDRWGTPTGAYSSGTEEEVAIAEESYGRATLLNVCIFFKSVAPAQLADPGENLKKVLAFRAKIEAERKYLYKAFSNSGEFSLLVEAYLADFLRQHVGRERDKIETAEPSVSGVTIPKSKSIDSYEYLIQEAGRLRYGPSSNLGAALYFAESAVKSAPGPRDRLRSLTLLAEVHISRRDFPSALAAAEVLDSLRPEVGLQDWREIQLVRLRVLEVMGRWEEVLDRSAGLVAAGPESIPGIRITACRALVHRANALDALGRHAEEIEAYQAVRSIAFPSSNAELRYFFSLASRNLAITQYQDGDFKSAISTVDELTKRIKSSTDWRVRSYLFAASIIHARSLRELGDMEGELRVLTGTVRRYERDPAEEVQELVASGLVKKGLALQRLKRETKAIESYDRIVETFADSDRIEIQRDVSTAMVLKAGILFRQKRYEDEIVTLSALIDRFSTSNDEEVSIDVCDAMRSRAISQTELGRNEEAVADYDAIIATYSQSDVPDIVRNVGRAFVSRGVRLSEMDKTIEELANYDRAIEVLSQRNVESARGAAAECYALKALTLAQFEQHGEAIEAVDKMFAKYGGDQSLIVLKEVAEALMAKARSLRALGRESDMLRTLDKVISLYEDQTEDGVRAIVAQARTMKAAALNDQGHLGEASLLLDEVVAMQGGEEELDVGVANAMRMKAIYLFKDNNSDSAVEVLRELIARFQESQSDRVKAVVSAARSAVASPR